MPTKAQEYSMKRIRQALSVIQELAPKEMQRFSRRRKHAMEDAYATLVLHADKLHLPIAALSTYYSPQAYLNNAYELERHLIVREIPVAIDQLKVDWHVQPASSEAIDYEGFHAIYGISPEEIDGLIAFIRLHRDDVAISNGTLEWVVLKRRGDIKE